MDNTAQAPERAALQAPSAELPARWVEVLEELAASSGLSLLTVEGRQPPSLAVSNNNSICRSLNPAGKFSRACSQFCGKALEKATELVPEDPTLNDHLGDAYWQTGRLVEARYQWRRALQFGPPENEVKPIEAKLERGLDLPAAPPRGG